MSNIESNVRPDPEFCPAIYSSDCNSYGPNLALKVLLSNPKECVNYRSCGVDRLVLSRCMIIFCSCLRLFLTCQEDLRLRGLQPEIPNSGKTPDLSAGTNQSKLQVESSVRDSDHRGVRMGLMARTHYESLLPLSMILR